MAFGAHKTEAIGMLISGAGELLYTHKQTHTHICEGCVVEILIIIFLARLPLILINWQRSSGRCIVLLTFYFVAWPRPESKAVNMDYLSGTLPVCWTWFIQEWT